MKNVKKISYCLLLFVAIFGLINPVFAAMEACNTIGGANINIDAKIADTIHIVILVIQIVVPVILVIFGSIDFLKAVTGGKEDEIKKGQQIFIKRVIAAVLVFFVIAIVKLLVGFVAGDESPNILNCVDCFLNGSETKECKTSYVKPVKLTETNNANNNQTDK